MVSNALCTVLAGGVVLPLYCSANCGRHYRVERQNVKRRNNMAIQDEFRLLFQLDNLPAPH
jgi:hypothetical protein